MPHRRAWLLIGIGYALWLALMVGLLLKARDWAVAQTQAPDAKAAWDAWKQEVERQNAEGAVKRKMPQSEQPPAVVLLMERFPGVMASCLVVGSFVYAFAAFLVWGVSSQGQRLPQPNVVEQGSDVGSKSAARSGQPEQSG